MTGISIIMPVRNAGPWLVECLDSILRQSMLSWELIAVDDHSTDASMDILCDYARDDDRIRVCTNRGHGIIDAVQLALDTSTYPWVSRMDADDIMPPDKLRNLWECLDQSNGAVATGKVHYFSEHPVTDGYRKYESWLNDRIVLNDHWIHVYRECVIAGANWLTHRKNVHFEKDRYPEDYNLVFEWYNRSVEVRSAPVVTHLWREHPERTSRRSAHYDQKSFFALKIRRFIEIDHVGNRPLVILGTNRKSRLTQSILRSESIPFQVVELSTLSHLATLVRPQVLVSVFPNEKERADIREFLTSHGLVPGSDWWWL